MTEPRASEHSDGRPNQAVDPEVARLRLLRRLGASGLDPAELAELPRSRRGRVAVLVHRARRDQRAALSLLVLLEPELTSIWRHLVRRGTEPEEAEAQTLAVAWQIVSGHRERQRPSSASGLANAIWTAVRRDAGHRRSGGLDAVSLPEGFDVAAPEGDHLEHWPGLLAAAVAAGVLTPRQVVVVAQTRMEGRPLVEVAKALGRPYDALRMERCRAEAALRAFALSYASSESES